MTANDVAQLAGQPAPADSPGAESADQAAPDAPDREDGLAPAPAAQEGPPPANAGPAKPAPGRSLKVVLTLKAGARPGGDGTPDPGYDALLSVGADGCDPLLRAAAGPDLAGILDEVPGLVAEAEARWATQPRFPKAPAPAAKPAARASGTAGDAKKQPKAARGAGPAARPAVAPSGGAAQPTAAEPPVAPAPPAPPAPPVAPAGAAAAPATSEAEGATSGPSSPAPQPAAPAAAAATPARDRPARANKPAPTGQLSLFG